MKKNKSLLKTQRLGLDEKLKAFREGRRVPVPKGGWIKAIREVLGMSSLQMAERMGIRQSGVILLEQREAEKKVTLETLQKAATALNCELVYALVPRESLEKTVDDQARAAARTILHQTAHSMALEAQQVAGETMDLHHRELAAELKSKMDRRLWKPK